MPVTLAAIGNGSTSYLNKNGTNYQMGSVQMNGMTVKTGDKIIIRGTAPRGNEKEALYTLTVGTLTRTFRIVTRPIVDTPIDNFDFVDKNDVAPGSSNSSNTIKFDGIPDNVPVSVSYKGSNASATQWVKLSTSNTYYNIPVNNLMVKSGVTLSLYGTASKNNDENSEYTLTVGNLEKKWNLKTRPLNQTPGDFAFNDVTSATISTNYTSNSVTPTNVPDPVPLIVEPTDPSSDDILYVKRYLSTDQYKLTGIVQTRIYGPTETLYIRSKSSAIGGQSKSFKVTIGDKTAVWTITTSP